MLVRRATIVPPYESTTSAPMASKVLELPRRGTVISILILSRELVERSFYAGS